MAPFSDGAVLVMLCCWAILLRRVWGSLGPPPFDFETDVVSIGRRQRRHLTVLLNATWNGGELPPPCDVAGLWHLPRARLSRHRPRQLWVRRQRWNGWPLRGKRIGEASHPGPPAPGTPVGGERPYGPRKSLGHSASPPMEVDAGDARVYCPAPVPAEWLRAHRASWFRPGMGSIPRANLRPVLLRAGLLGVWAIPPCLLLWLCKVVALALCAMCLRQLATFRGGS